MWGLTILAANGDWDLAGGASRWVLAAPAVRGVGRVVLMCGMDDQIGRRGEICRDIETPKGPTSRVLMGRLLLSFSRQARGREHIPFPPPPPVALYLSFPLDLVWLPLESPIVRATGIEHFAGERGRPS